MHCILVIRVCVKILLGRLLKAAIRYEQGHLPASMQIFQLPKRQTANNTDVFIAPLVMPNGSTQTSEAMVWNNVLEVLDDP